jgi:hypothetical protein
MASIGQMVTTRRSAICCFQATKAVILGCRLPLYWAPTRSAVSFLFAQRSDGRLGRSWSPALRPAPQTIARLLQVAEKRPPAAPSDRWTARGLVTTLRVAAFVVRVRWPTARLCAYGQSQENETVRAPGPVAHLDDHPGQVRRFHARPRSGDRRAAGGRSGMISVRTCTTVGNAQKRRPAAAARLVETFWKD